MAYGFSVSVLRCGSQRHNRVKLRKSSAPLALKMADYRCVCVCVCLDDVSRDGAGKVNCVFVYLCCIPFGCSLFSQRLLAGQSGG